MKGELTADRAIPELRQDILTGEWVVIASSRATRPESFSTEPKKPPKKYLASCPFCSGNEAQTPPEVFAIRPADSANDTTGWKVRVVPNKFPALLNEGWHSPATEERGIYSFKQALGHHEVIVHSPDHNNTLAQMDPEYLELVLRVYQDRLEALSKDPKAVSAIIIINQGREAGASIEHPHSQLFTLPLLAPRLKLELEKIKGYQSQHGQCLVCSMIENEHAHGQRLVAENEHFSAFCPFASRSPFEIFIAPKKHQSAFGQADGAQLRSFAHILKLLFSRLQERLGDPPYNAFLHTRPFRGRKRDYHWHFVILPKISTVAGFEFGTDITINVVEPEAAAEFLR
ncbi:MAG TPA: galactose-1-phosphate uridylyltransferase [Actinobacteria bacterium]|nr:galactose-1-phosphate uridylyltransferase [Actinomycetota bacterium]